MSKIVECLQKPDEYKFIHIMLHVAAVLMPFALAFWSPWGAAVSVASWGVVFLVIGGHGEKALGGNLGAFGWSVGNGLLVAVIAAFTSDPAILLIPIALCNVAISWITEYHQNGGVWCGQDRANFHNRLTGALIGTVAAIVYSIAS